MESRSPQGLCSILLCCLFLNHGSEYSMRSWTFLVHVCASNVPVFVSFLDKIYHFIFVRNLFLYTILQESLAFIFSNLEFLMVIVKQVIYCLIINLNIWAFDIKIYLRDVFVKENCLILKWLVSTFGLFLCTLTLRRCLSLVLQRSRIADLIYLIKEILKAAR